MEWRDDDLDIKSMIDIERFRKINIQAQQATDVYTNTNLSPQSNVDFSKRCVVRFQSSILPIMKPATSDARLERGKWVWRDGPQFGRALDNADARAGLLAIAPNTYSSAVDAEQTQTDVTIEKMHTLALGHTQFVNSPTFAIEQRAERLHSSSDHVYIPQ